MENNIIKLAYLQLNKPQDIIKTAGILRFLRNKIVSMFDDEKSQDVQKMLDSTSDIKPLLSSTYRLIKDVESAINDLDIDAYNNSIEELRIKIKELNDAVNKFEKVEAQQIEERKEPDVTKQETSIPEIKPEPIEDKVIEPQKEIIPKIIGLDEYNKINKLSDLGISANDIITSPQSFNSFKRVLFKIIDQDDLKQEITNLSDENIQTTFYNKIPDMRIVDVTLRKPSKEGRERLGFEITVRSNKEKLQPPADNWQIVADFVLVDNRTSASHKPIYNLYINKILSAYNSETEITYLQAKK